MVRCDIPIPTAAIIVISSTANPVRVIGSRFISIPLVRRSREEGLPYNIYVLFTAPDVSALSTACLLCHKQGKPLGPLDDGNGD
ncbi:hypothetical protein W02_23490 [Nitrospira sp. KM1]|nr:hypothetical protein W02_23490 [Nitrospira sp. KM1]